MANEISISLSLSVSKNGATASASNAIQITMSGNNFINNVQTVGTSNEAILVGDVAGGGFVYCKNTDATNYIEISLDNAQAQVVAKLLPGEFCIFKPETDTLYAKANTGPVNLQVIAMDL
jgi:hypothetical protein